MSLLGAAVALGLGALAGSATGAADAEPPPVPVAADDVVVITPLMGIEAEVLANDGGGDPVAADLQVCRFDPNDAGLDVQIWSHDGWPGDGVIRPGSTYLDLEPDRRLAVGDHTVEYAACDRHHTAWATLTVSVRRVGAPRVADAPTRVRFTNPLDHQIGVVWWHRGERGHRLRLTAGQSREVEMGADATRWLAFDDAGGDDPRLLDSGRVAAFSEAPPAGRRAAPSVAATPDEPLDTTPPVTTPDRITLDYYDSADLAVLANDVDDRPGDLAICRVEVPATDFAVTALPVPSWGGGATGEGPVLDVSASSADPGTYEITYYACDREQLTPGTVTVTVREFPLPRIHRVEGRPGLVRVHNRGYRTIDVQYFRAGRYSERFHLRVPPHRSGTIRVSYDTLDYFVDTAIGPLTHGRLRHVQRG